MRQPFPACAQSSALRLWCKIMQATGWGTILSTASKIGATSTVSTVSGGFRVRERKASRVVCMCSVQTTDELSLRDGFSSIFAILSRSLCAFFLLLLLCLMWPWSPLVLHHFARSSVVRSVML